MIGDVHYKCSDCSLGDTYIDIRLIRTNSLNLCH